jgi:hypothetical protein
MRRSWAGRAGRHQNPQGLGIIQLLARHPPRATTAGLVTSLVTVLGQMQGGATSSRARARSFFDNAGWRQLASAARPR